MTIDKQICILNQATKIRAFKMQELQDIIFYTEFYLDKVMPICNYLLVIMFKSIIARVTFDTIKDKYNSLIERGIYGN